MSLVETLHGTAAMTGVGAPWEAKGELTGEGKEGEGGEGGAARGAPWSGYLGSPVWSPCSWWLLLCSVLRVREEEHRKVEGEEKREKRTEEGKEKRKGIKNGKIFQTWKFLERKIKDNL
jgi:hypothetical protein